MGEHWIFTTPKAPKEQNPRKAGRTVLPVSKELENFLEVRDKAGKDSVKIRPTPINVQKKDKLEGEKEKEKGADDKMNMELEELLFQDVNDEKEVRETRSKLKKQIRKTKQFQKICQGMFAKYKISSFTVKVLTLFLKMGLNRKNIDSD